MIACYSSRFLPMFSIFFNSACKHILLACFGVFIIIYTHDIRSFGPDLLIAFGLRLYWLNIFVFISHVKKKMRLYYTLVYCVLTVCVCVLFCDTIYGSVLLALCCGLLWYVTCVAHAIRPFVRHVMVEEVDVKSSMAHAGGVRSSGRGGCTSSWRSLTCAFAGDATQGCLHHICISMHYWHKWIQHVFV